MSKENKTEKCCKRTSIGGQAVIEGIMMNGPHRTVLAVRSKHEGIVIEDVKRPNIREKCPLLKLPLLRGIVAYIESMIMGYSTITRSAELSGLTELEEDEKSDSVGKDEKAETVENTENTETVEKDEPKKKSSRAWDALMSVVMVLSTVLGVALAVVLFMYIPTKLFNLVNGVAGGAVSGWRPLFEGILKIVIFLAYILLVSLTKDIKRLFKYHGAEHKTIFCYESGLELNVENVRRQIRFHPRCGTSFLFLMIAVGILVSTLLVIFAPGLTHITWLWVTVKILLIPLFCGLGYELIKLCGRYDNLATKIIAAPGLWIQRITTKEPDDDMIEVAIESIKAVIPENSEDDKW